MGDQVTHGNSALARATATNGEPMNVSKNKILATVSAGLGTLGFLVSPRGVTEYVSTRGSKLLDEYLDFQSCVVYFKFLAEEPTEQELTSWLKTLESRASSEGLQEYRNFLKTVDSRLYPFSALVVKEDLSGSVKPECAAGILIVHQRKELLRDDPRNRWLESSYFQFHDSVIAPASGFVDHQLMSTLERGWVSWGLKNGHLDERKVTRRPAWARTLIGVSSGALLVSAAIRVSQIERK